MNLKAKLARAILFLALCALSAFGALWRFSATQAQEYPPSQFELRSDSLMKTGEPFVVSIFANVASPAYGFGLQVRYDPNVLQLQPQPDNDGTLVPLRVGGVFMSAQRIRNTDGLAESASVIDVVYTLLPPAEPTTGEGFIGRISFITLQETSTQLELLSPRLIALENGTAVDLPVNAVPILAVMPAAAAPEAEVITELNSVPVALPALETQPQIQQPAPVVETQPEVQTVLASLNTSSDILAQMNRTNALMNAVLVGLLTMITILLGVISISSVLDAFEAARAPRPVLAYAAMSPRTVRAQRPQPARRPSQTRQVEEARRRMLNRVRNARNIDTRDL
jgi:hypothetical protein